MHRSLDILWQVRIILRQSFLASGWFWRVHLIMKTQVKTSTKRVSVGQKWPNHGPTWSENINQASSELICSQVISKSRHSLSFWCVSSHLVSTNCCLEKPDSAVRDVISPVHYPNNFGLKMHQTEQCYYAIGQPSYIITFRPQTQFPLQPE